MTTKGTATRRGARSRGLRLPLSLVSDFFPSQPSSPVAQLPLVLLRYIAAFLPWLDSLAWYWTRRHQPPPQPIRTVLLQYLSGCIGNASAEFFLAELVAHKGRWIGSSLLQCLLGAEWQRTDIDVLWPPQFSIYGSESEETFWSHFGHPFRHDPNCSVYDEKSTTVYQYTCSRKSGSCTSAENFHFDDCPNSVPSREKKKSQNVDDDDNFVYVDDDDDARYWHYCECAWVKIDMICVKPRDADKKAQTCFAHQHKSTDLSLCRIAFDGHRLQIQYPDALFERRGWFTDPFAGVWRTAAAAKSHSWHHWHRNTWQAAYYRDDRTFETCLCAAMVFEAWRRLERGAKYQDRGFRLDRGRFVFDFQRAIALAERRCKCRGHCCDAQWWADQEYHFAEAGYDWLWRPCKSSSLVSGFRHHMKSLAYVEDSLYDPAVTSDSDFTDSDDERALYQEYDADYEDEPAVRAMMVQQTSKRGRLLRSRALVSYKQRLPNRRTRRKERRKEFVEANSRAT